MEKVFIGGIGFLVLWAILMVTYGALTDIQIQKDSNDRLNRMVRDCDGA